MNDAILSRVRSRFPLFESTIYLAACAHAPLSLDVSQALRRYERTLFRQGLAWQAWREEAEQARTAFAELIHARPQEIMLMSSTKSILNALFASFPWGRRDQILMLTPTCSSEGIHGLSACLPWEKDALYLPARQAMSLEDAVQHPRTALLVADRSGDSRTYLARIAHACGVLLLVNANDMVGVSPIHVEESGIDLLVCETQRYLLGLPGLTFLYIRPGLEQVIAKLAHVHRHDAFYTPALAEEPIPVPQVYAACAGMRLVQECGVSLIGEHLAHLNAQAIQYAQTYGFSVVDSSCQADRKPFITLDVGPVASQFAAHLAQMGVLLASSPPFLVLAPGLYTTEQEIELSLEMLAEVRERTLCAARPPITRTRRQKRASFPYPQSGQAALFPTSSKGEPLCQHLS